MCFIIALVLFAFSYHSFLQSELLSGFGALAGALFFVALMVKNIFDVKKRKEEEKNDN
jgi:hypothetical protein